MKILNYIDFYVYFKTLRVNHWTKNLLIFTPILTAHVYSYQNIVNSILAFIIMSLFASCGYIFNDLIDKKNDIDNPEKKNRPIASGLLSIKECSILISLLLIIGIAFCFFINFKITYHLFSYLVLSLVYSLVIKKIFLIDIFILSIFYTFRVYLGGVISDIELSYWLSIYSFFIFLSLASIKRQTEIINLYKRNLFKIPGRNYSFDNFNFIKYFNFITSFLSVLILSFYINSYQANILYSYPIYLWGILIIKIFWLVRLNYISLNGSLSLDPIEFLVKDKISYICMLLSIFLFYKSL